MITCGQVPSVSSYGPEGFNRMRSAPHSAPEVLMQIYLETWSLRWERPSTEEHIWRYNSMTSPFFCFSPFSLSSLFYTLNNDGVPVSSSGSLSQSDLQTGVVWWTTSILSLSLSCFPQPHHSPLTRHLDWMTSFGAAFNHSTLQLWWRMALCRL